MEKDLTQVKAEDLKKIKEDLELIKEALFSKKNIEDPEGELSEETKKELKQARETSEEEYVSSEEIKKEFL